MKLGFRLRSIEIKNLKNIGHAKITIPEAYSPEKGFNSNIIGFYGPNGSGKSTVITSLHILYNMLKGLNISEEKHLVSFNEKSAKLYYAFDIYITENDVVSLFGHISFQFMIKEKNEKYVLYNEKLNVETSEREPIELYYGSRTPDIDIRQILSTLLYDCVDKLDITALKSESQIDSSSFLFKILEQIVSDDSYLKKIAAQDRQDIFEAILVMYSFLLYIFELSCNDDSIFFTNRMSANFNRFSFPLDGKYQNVIFEIVDLYFDDRGYVSTIPSAGCLKEIGETGYGFSKEDLLDSEFDIENNSSENLYGIKSFIIVGDGSRAHIPDDKMNNLIKKFSEYVSYISSVLGLFIPGIEFEIKEKGRNIYTLYVKKDGLEVPFTEESYGVRKLFSMLLQVSKVFSNPYSLIFIDEIDEGLFEYFFGEILKVLKDKGQGQLIFTAHNLRALEMLDRKNIYFATDDLDKKFVTLSNIKPTNNLRDVYLRRIYMSEGFNSIDTSILEYGLFNLTGGRK